MSSGRATAIGFGAVLLWALLALFTVNAAGVPPFQLSAMCFAIGGTLGIAWILVELSGLGLVRYARAERAMLAITSPVVMPACSTPAG